MLQALRRWWPLLLAVLLVQIGNGLQATLIGLRSNEAGFSASLIAFVMSALYAGQVTAPIVAPRLIARFGHVPFFVAVALVMAAAPFLFAIEGSAGAWAMGRFLVGFGLAGIFVVIESWLNDRSDNETRGRVFALYILVQLGGLIAAQSIVPALAGQMLLAAFAVSAFALTSIPPVAFGTMPRPTPRMHVPASFGRLWTASPTGVAGVAISGVVWAMVASIAAIYAQRKGLDVDEVAFFVSIAITGGLLLQFPIGWLSDVRDRRLVLGAMASVATAAALVAAMDGYGSAATPIAYAIFGGVTFPFYTVAAAHLNDHIEPEQRVSASAAVILIFGAGSILGPVVASWAMAAAGPDGFFLALAAATGGLAMFTWVRAARTA